MEQRQTIRPGKVCNQGYSLYETVSFSSALLLDPEKSPGRNWTLPRNARKGKAEVTALRMGLRRQLGFPG